mgnify:CR=1 FL=1
MEIEDYALTPGVYKEYYVLYDWVGTGTEPKELQRKFYSKLEALRFVEELNRLNVGSMGTRYRDIEIFSQKVTVGKFKEVNLD